MYSPKKVAERIAEAETEFQTEFVRHTVDEVVEFEQHLTRHGMYLYDNSGRPSGTQNLTQYEHDWIKNEQVLLMTDAEYALTRYCFLKDQQNTIRRFEFRVPQRILFDIIGDLEEDNRTLEFIILKARQLGMSTLIECLIALRIIFGYGVNAVIGSADQTKTGLMVNMLFLMYDMLPVWIRPPFTRRVESDRGMLVFGQNMSGVSFQHGAQMSGIARGTTPTIYHLSEVASFTNAVDQIESSLFRAVHPSPNVFGFLESSGEGDKGWWPERWRSSRDYWANHRARHCPLFLPYFCGIEMYPSRHWITYDQPLDPEWIPNATTREHVAKCEMYVEHTPLIKKHLIEDQKRRGTEIRERWRMPREQQWFWEFGNEEARRTGTTSKWLQEMCADDEEALQRSAVSAFSHETIYEIDQSRDRNYQMFAIVGQSIERDHEPQPEVIDYQKDRVPIRYFNEIKEESYRWELVPLRINPPPREDVTEDATGIFFIWHHPQPNVHYSVGVDTSAGKGHDQTAISVWALGAGDAPDVQCAEYTSAYVSHTEALPFVMAISAYYKSKMSDDNTRWREPYVTIEQLAAVGDVVQSQMATMGYRNFHTMSRYDGKSPSRDKLVSRRRGWYTSGWSRPVLIDSFVQWVKNRWVVVESPWLLEEMKTFEMVVTTSGKEKMEHGENFHDDRIFASAMATYAPHDLDPQHVRSKQRTIEREVLPPLDLRPYQPNTFSPSDLAQTSVASLSDILYDAEQLERYK